MKKDYVVLGLIGSLIWFASMPLREMNLPNNEILLFLVGTCPNFGVVWVGVGYTIGFYSQVFHHEFDDSKFYLLLLGIMILLITSEIVHDVFLNSKFDIWDLVVSLVSMVIICLIHKRINKRQQLG